MKRSVRMVFGLAVLVVLVIAVPAFGKPGPLEEPRLLMLSFDKASVGDGIWEGTVSGDVSGTLRTELTGQQSVGPLRLVEYNWIVDAGDHSFSVSSEGTLNTLTGMLVMSGEVTDGARTGASSYEQGQLINPETGRYSGTIMIVDWVEVR